MSSRKEVGPETGENKKSLFPEKIAKEKGEKIGNVIWVSPVPPVIPEGISFPVQRTGVFRGKDRGYIGAENEDAGGFWS
jgi:hypothetical protein